MVVKLEEFWEGWTEITGRYKDISGERFGVLTAISLNIEESKRINQGAVWNVQCDCGRLSTRLYSRMKAGITTSRCGDECDYARGRKSAPKESNNLIGFRRGSLEVTGHGELRPTKSGKGKRKFWECVCHECNQIFFWSSIRINNPWNRSCDNRDCIESANIGTDHPIYKWIGVVAGRLKVKEWVGKNTFLCVCTVCNTERRKKSRELQGILDSPDEYGGCYRCKLNGELVDCYERDYYRQYKYGADQREFSFNLSIDEFKMLIYGDCAYCGDPPKEKVFRYGKVFSNGIDRVDSSIGYSLDNCVPCCGVDNVMKMDMAEDDFLIQIEKIYKNRIGNNR